MKHDLTTEAGRAAAFEELNEKSLQGLKFRSREMTNAENILEQAVELLEKGQLNKKESEFVESIKDYTKKDLKRLSYKQYIFLRDIANK